MQKNLKFKACLGNTARSCFKKKKKLKLKLNLAIDFDISSKKNCISSTYNKLPFLGQIMHNFKVHCKTPV
jgi:hypothetical protein